MEIEEVLGHKLVVFGNVEHDYSLEFGQNVHNVVIDIEIDKLIFLVSVLCLIQQIGTD